MASSAADRAASGRSLRSSVPRSSHGDWEPAPDRADPVALLEEQAADRLAELVPIRYGRMAASPFAFFRGAAYVMAHDLAATPNTGIRVQACGDAHLSNFGAFAAPDRELVFDLNDFDETLPGPWEWDLKRLAASIVVAGRDNGFSQRQREPMVRQAVAEYREAMRTFADMGTLEVWYARANVDQIHEVLRAQGSPRDVAALDRIVAKGRRKDSARALEKLGVQSGGEERIRADPPLIVPIADLVPESEAARFHDDADELIRSYRRSLLDDRRRLLERFRYGDLARKVVGVGSVGTRCWVVLLLGRDAGDPLFLQIKEAQRSVLEPFAGRSRFRNQGQRVVVGQRLMQAASDIFIGWLRAPAELGDGEPRDFYVRQLWDAKTSADITLMRASAMALYARLCAWTLARAHARSGDAIAIAQYLGRSDTFDIAITKFAEFYADQNERDHEALLQAIAAGRVQAEEL